ncbi:MAG: hypothetical protein R3Y50_01090 [Rikenellaceae bacterium]
MIREIDYKEVVDLVRRAKREGITDIKTSEDEPKRAPFNPEAKNLEQVHRCYAHWNNFSNLRESRRRNIRFLNGNQWSDFVEDPDFRGRKVREDKLIARSGQMPLTHNIIAQIVRNLTGQMLSNPTQSIVFARSDEDNGISELLTTALESCHQLNNITKLNVTQLQELILSGICCAKVGYSYIDEQNGYDGKVDAVNINRFFYNSDAEDPRLLDVTLIGELHEYTIDEIITNFATCQKDEANFHKIFTSNTPDDSSLHKAGEMKMNTEFTTPLNPSKFRIIELWERESHWVNYLHDPLDATGEITDLSEKEVKTINKKRIQLAIDAGGTGSEIPLLELTPRYETYWSVSFMDINGHILSHEITPYAHESHPYVISTMPILDGQFRSYISDLIDMQRYINRLIMMIDFIIGSSAKGVLMLPEDCIPDGCSVDSFAQEYIKTNGVIVYRPNNMGTVPTQISSNSNPATAWDMLRTQLSLIEQVSGVTDAMQGKSTGGATASSLYSQQISTSQLNSMVIFEIFNSFINERDTKLTKTIMQFYEEQRLVNISGLDSLSSVYYWDTVEIEKIQNFNLVVSHTYQTPTYKLKMEDQLLNMLNNRFIDFKTYLKNSTLPFSKRLLANINSEKEPTYTPLSEQELNELIELNKLGLTDQQTEQQTEQSQG